MEQILAFVLGVGAVAFVWVVVVAFKTSKKVEALKSNQSEMIDWIQKNDELVNRRVDQEIDRVDRLHSDSLSFTDSRVDKLEQKYLDQTKSKKLIKG